MKFTEILYSKLYKQIQDYLKRMHDKAGEVFTPASPYGQILDVLIKLVGLNTLYAKRARAMLDINDPASRNVRSVRSLAVLAGHNPYRAQASSGALVLKLKSGTDADDIGGGSIVMQDKMRLRCTSNNLTYSLDLGTESVKYPVRVGEPIIIRVVQGTWERQSFTGTGEKNQSIVLQTKGGLDVDNFRYRVMVNSTVWSPRQHMYKMLPNGNEYWAKTGVDSALVVNFGNGDFGAVPPVGSLIEIEYLLTNGREGNVPNPKSNEFRFVDDVTDGHGESVDVARLFDMTSDGVTMGSDGESMDLTMSIMPFSGAAGALSKPEHFATQVKRLGVFAQVDAYVTEGADQELLSRVVAQMEKTGSMLQNAIDSRGADLNLRNKIAKQQEQTSGLLDQLTRLTSADTVYLFLVPDVTRYYGSTNTMDYFDIPTSEFVLSGTDKERVLDYLTRQGHNSVKTSVKIVDPVVARYVVNVTVRLFEGTDIRSVRAELRARCSDMLLALSRRDRVPPSDFIRVAEGVSGVDSVDVSFMSEANERYHGEYIKKYEQFYIQNGRAPEAGEVVMSDGTNYDATRMVGLDPIMGDAVLQKQQLFMVRGGWTDRNGQAYASGMSDKGPGALNLLVLPERSKKR